MRYRHGRFTRRNDYACMWRQKQRPREGCSLLEKGVCVHVCVLVCARLCLCAVTSDNRNCKFQAHKSPGDFKTAEDKQRRHPGMFCGQPNKNKSLYAHGRIIIARRQCVAIIMPRGATNLLDTSAIPQETQIPTCTKFTPLFLHNYTPTTEGHVGSWFGFSNEIAAILMLSSPSNSHL